MAATASPPLPREGTVSRPALVDRLCSATLAALVAPPGYGKTTLLAEAAAGVPGRPVLWLAPGDPDAIDPGDGPVCVAIDDAHLLGSELARVGALAARLQPGSALLLASRTPLPVELLGVDGLVVLGTEDLRMSAAEAAVLVRAAGADATDAEIADLTDRLEGWPAGLFLAALAHETDGVEPAAFGPSDRFIREYLHDEWLAGLPPDDVRFLRRCSALDEPAGPICDAALGTSRSAARLGRLAGSNLFISAQGAPGRTFRVHPVLREALAADLHHDDPDLAPAIASRAADWCEGRGDLAGAVSYAWSAREHDRFAGLVERSAAELYRGGELVLLERWLALPDDRMLAHQPMLAIWAAFVGAVRGHARDAEHRAELAEAAGAGPELAVLRAALCVDGVERMAADAGVALGTLPAESPWRPVALVLLLVARRLAGGNEGTDALEAAEAVPPDLAGLALSQQAAAAIDAGDHDVAEVLVARARAVLPPVEDYPTSALAHAVSARSAVHRSDWVRAHADTSRADRLLPMLTIALPWLAVQARLELAKARLGLSEHDEAARLLSEAATLLAEGPDLGSLAARAEALRQELGGTPDPDEGWGRLTPAEQRLLPLLTTHLSFREIAESLDVSRNTVKTQAICVYRKLNVSSRSAAIERASELGLVERPGALDPV